MAFKGTESRSALDIAVEIECLGASINAITSQEITAYHINGLKDSVAEAVAILGDVLTRSRYADEDVALERNVIGQEIARQGDDPNALCIVGFLGAAFPDQPMGRPVLGSPAFVANAARADLLSFVNSHYFTGSMVVAATGDFAHDWFAGLVEKHFSTIPTGAAADRAVPVYAGGEHITRRTDFKQVNVALGFPSVAIDAPGYYAHKMLAAALGGGMASPLFQEVRQKRGLVYGVGAGSNHGSDFGVSSPSRAA